MVAVNGYDEPPQVVRSYVEREGLKQAILLQGGDVARHLYGVRAYPTGFWLDHQGVVLERKVGFRPSDASLMEARLEALLRARGAPR